MHARIEEFLTTWRSAKGHHRMPLQGDIGMKMLAPLLPSTLIVENLAAGGLFVRMAGTSACALFGREISGQPFLALWQEKDRRDMARLLDGMLQDGLPVRLGILAHQASGTSRSAELALAPLRSENGSAQRIIGCFSSSDDFMLGGDSILHLSMTSLRVVDPARQNGQGINGAGLAPADVALRRGHLVLLRSDAQSAVLANSGSRVIRR
jgi:hypothetical protein